MDTTEARREAPQEIQEEDCCATRPKARRSGPWLIGGAVLAVPLALYAGWDWLVAVGLATPIVALAPCLVMCALGLCMGRGRKP